MRTNKFIVPAVTGLVIVLTLVLTIIVKSGTPFELTLLLVYVGVGIITLLIITLLDKLHKRVKVQKRGGGHKTYKNGISLHHYFFINNNFEFIRHFGMLDCISSERGAKL